MDKKKRKGLSGFTLTRNCIRNDYCFDLTIQSLLNVCDEVVVSDAESDDGTLPFLLDWAARESKLKIRNYKWPEPKGNSSWFTDWINSARHELSFAHMLQLDADEVLSDDSTTVKYIKAAVENHDAFAFNRLNFARDAKSLIPEGECCGKFVVRIGPSHLWLPSDEPHERGQLHILDMAYNRPDAFIFHLGFLRRPEAFFAKAKVVLGAFFDNYDTRLVAAQAEGRAPLSGFEWWNRLTPYTGHYPKAVRQWMTDRGYTVP